MPLDDYNQAAYDFALTIHADAQGHGVLLRDSGLWDDLNDFQAGLPMK